MSQKTIKHEYTSIESEYSSVFMRDPAETTCLISNTDSCIPYYTLRFRATNLEIETTREYKGLLESISEVGGMLFIVMLLFKSVCGIYHQLAVRQHLIREVFAVSSKKGIEYDKAVERFEKLRQLEPMNSEYYYYLADIYSQLGQKDKAVKALEVCKTLTTSEDARKNIDELIKDIKNN